jgi:HD-like signal output (HDOD) protein
MREGRPVRAPFVVVGGRRGGWRVFAALLGRRGRVAPRCGTMSVNPELRSLDIDIPAQPDALVKLSLLLADDDINLSAAAELIEGDMALAAAVMKAVNSSLYGLRGRVQSVMQAITYLGMREVAAITFEMGLRAAFPPAPELEPIWQRAGLRGLLMGRLAQKMSLDAWGAHSAGLFEECGKAVLFRHAPEHYRAMLRAAGSDAELAQLEHTGFGVSHDALGAALCESWGLAPAAVASVRHHVLAQADHELPAALPAGRRSLLALSIIVQALRVAPEQLDAAAAAVAPQADLDATLLLRGVRQIKEQLDEATAHGR